MAHPLKTYAAMMSNAEEVRAVAQNNVTRIVKHALIDANTSGNNQIVAAVTGMEILVLAYNYMSNGAVNAHWRSNNTSISGPAYMDGPSKGKVCGYNPKGWVKTAAGEPLNLNLSAAVAVGGEITYVEVLPTS